MSLFEMNEIATILFFGACFMIGWYSREWYAVRTLKKLLGKATTNIAQNGIMTIHVKKADAGFDVFDSKDDTFLANVASKKEMMEFLKKKFPDTAVIMNRENNKVFDESL